MRLPISPLPLVGSEREATAILTAKRRRGSLQCQPGPHRGFQGESPRARTGLSSTIPPSVVVKALRGQARSGVTRQKSPAAGRLPGDGLFEGRRPRPQAEVCARLCCRDSAWPPKPLPERTSPGPNRWTCLPTAGPGSASLTRSPRFPARPVFPARPEISARPVSPWGRGSSGPAPADFGPPGGLEAAPGFEPGVTDLQSVALPLGYAAAWPVGHRTGAA